MLRNSGYSSTNFTHGLLLLVFLSFAGPVSAQQETGKVKQDNQTENSQDTAEVKALTQPALEDRVSDMEKRVAHLERLLFSTAQLTVYDAERRLDDAKIQLEQSHRLYLKGVIQQHQINHDQFLVRRAERELDLAKAKDGQYRITAEIDCLQAEYNLDVAQRQLDFSQSMLTKGYTTKEKIRRQESALDRAKKANDLARQKLETLKNAELQGLKK